MHACAARHTLMPPVSEGRRVRGTEAYQSTLPAHA